MAIRFKCGACAQPIEIDDEWALKAVACPYCRKTVTAPAESTLGELAEIPTATALAPVTPIMAPPPDETSTAATLAHPNRIATIALALGLLQLVLFVVLKLLIASHWLELEGLVKTAATSTNYSEILEAEKSFLESYNGVVPGWLWLLGLSTTLFGLVWIATVVCGVISVYRQRDRGRGIASLVISGGLLFLYCGGALFGSGL